MEGKKEALQEIEYSSLNPFERAMIYYHTPHEFDPESLGRFADELMAYHGCMEDEFALDGNQAFTEEGKLDKKRKNETTNFGDFTQSGIHEISEPPRKSFASEGTSHFVNSLDVKEDNITFTENRKSDRTQANNINLNWTLLQDAEATHSKRRNEATLFGDLTIQSGLSELSEPPKKRICNYQRYANSVWKFEGTPS